MEAGHVHTGPTGYRRVVLDFGGRKYKAGRVAWLYMTGSWPTFIVDHEDGDATNNRWMNLRDCSVAVNQENRRRATHASKTGVLGVIQQARSKKFVSQISVSGKTVYLGTFDSPVMAHSAYLAAKREIHAGCTI
jgi:hypothetical protein